MNARGFLSIPLRHHKLWSIAALSLFMATLTLPQAWARDHKEKKEVEPSSTKLRIIVTAGKRNEPVANASVYIKYREPRFLRHNKRIEMDLKTDLEGSVKVPPLPHTKILIQIVAPGWRTYGKYYVLGKDEETLKIKLLPPPHWY